MDSCVLDASAVLAMILGEKGGDAVWQRRRGALVSMVNHAEVLGRLIRHGMTLDDSRTRLAQVNLDLVPFDKEQAAVTASLLAVCKPFGLSLGDRACVGLALLRGLPILTSDRNWKKLALDVPIEVIR